jgi:hypothetical protein
MFRFMRWASGGFLTRYTGAPLLCFLQSLPGGSAGKGQRSAPSFLTHCISSQVGDAWVYGIFSRISVNFSETRIIAPLTRCNSDPASPLSTTYSTASRLTSSCDDRLLSVLFRLVSTAQLMAAI